MKFSDEQWDALFECILNPSLENQATVKRLLVGEEPEAKPEKRRTSFVHDEPVDTIVAKLNELSGVYTTKELGAMLPGVRLITWAHLMPAGYATHDGMWFEKYGKKMRAWRWHGKKQ